MLHNTENTGLPNSAVLEAMGLAKFEFYLTGSRFMRYAVRPDSDWDFMVQDSTKVREFLETIGFDGLNILHYEGKDGNGGTLTNAVWQTCEAIDPTDWLSELRVIQVQLVPDVKRKLTVRDMIATQTVAALHADMGQEDRFTFWEMLGRMIPVEL